MLCGPGVALGTRASGSGYHRWMRPGSGGEGKQASTTAGRSVSFHSPISCPGSPPHSCSPVPGAAAGQGHAPAQRDNDVTDTVVPLEVVADPDHRRTYGRRHRSASPAQAPSNRRLAASSTTMSGRPACPVNIPSWTSRCPGSDCVMHPQGSANLGMAHRRSAITPVPLRLCVLISRYRTMISPHVAQKPVELYGRVGT